MKSIVLHADAEAELRETLDYYEGKQPGLGGDFLRAFEAALQLIRQNPQAYAFDAATGARYCLMRRFPYTLWTIELEDRIWVVAVAHQKRRPNYWLHRNPE